MGCAESKSDGNQRPKYRVCTDVFWLSIFIIFWLFLIVIAIFSFVYGNPLRLINGYDSFGNTCGVAKNERYTSFGLSGLDMSDKPYLFFLEITKLHETLKICVKQCPKKTINTNRELYNYYKDHNTQLCRYDFNMSLLEQLNDNNLKYSNFLGPCPTYPVYKSVPVLHRCIPVGKEVTFDKIKDLYGSLNSWDIAQKFISDMYKAWPFILLSTILALIFSIILIALMHYLTSIVSWLICILVMVTSVALSVILWWTYYRIKYKHLEVDYSLLDQFVRNETAVYVLAILATIIMIIIICVVYFLRKKITGMTALFEEAGVCMLSLPGLVIPPILAFIGMLAFLAFWVFVVVCITTANYPGVTPLHSPLSNLSINDVTTISSSNYNIVKNSTDDDYRTIKRVEYIPSTWIRSMLWIYFIGLIWTSEFIFACQQFTLAAAVAYWYFRKPTDTPVFYAMGRLFRYHLGSVAKGSFVITLFKIPRLILTYLYTKLKKAEDKGSECAKCCLKGCICCFWLLEKFIRFLNHNAYTVIAIESINFCPAAGIAWNAMATNAIQVATVNSVGDFILFLGKLIVAALCGIIGILMLRDRDDIQFYIAPVIFIIVFSFFIAHIILSLFEIVVDTLFLCVCEDKTINGNSGRWKQSNLAKLLGEEPLPVDEGPIQAVEMTPINKQPFSNINVTA